MKRIKILFGLLIFLISTADLFALVAERPVGAPLDGGLLAILGAAGIAYYIARKKKKASDQV